jgi:hypothetical protein
MLHIEADAHIDLEQRVQYEMLGTDLSRHGGGHKESFDCWSACNIFVVTSRAEGYL